MCSVESTGGMEPLWKSSQTCVIAEPQLETRGSRSSVHGPAFYKAAANALTAQSI